MVEKENKSKRSKKQVLAQTQMLKSESPEQNEEMGQTAKSAPISSRAMWSGSISIGLINVPIKLYAMIFDRGLTFHFLHKNDNAPLKYQKVCTKDNVVVPWLEVARGYEVAKNEYVVFDQKELDAVRPESDRRIRVDKFVDYFSVDPVYFSTSYVLLPDKSKEAYSLLLNALQSMGKAAAGRITMRTKEYPALVHAYKGALVLTIMRYSYDVSDPQDFEQLKKIKAPDPAELNLAKKIVSDLSGEFNIGEYHDTYREKVEELIKKKLKGETITVEKVQPKEEVKSLMSALQETLKQLEKK
jgi:DNA end-binding protein Ku